MEWEIRYFKLLLKNNEFGVKFLGFKNSNRKLKDDKEEWGPGIVNLTVHFENMIWN